MEVVRSSNDHGDFIRAEEDGWLLWQYRLVLMNPQHTFEASQEMYVTHETFDPTSNNPDSLCKMPGNWEMV